MISSIGRRRRFDVETPLHSTPTLRPSRAHISPKNSRRLRIALCVLTTGAAILLLIAAAVVLNKAGVIDGVASSPAMLGAGAVLLCGLFALAAVYFLAFRGSSPEERGVLWLSIGAATLVGAVFLVGAEVILRGSAVSTALSVRIGALELLPFDWEQARRTSRAWLDRTRGEHALLDIEDADLGWDLGRGRRSADGMYATSVEGVRSADPADVLAAQQSHFRVALLGDSFTFGEEAAFEDTWGRQLERALPAGAQVLNFGVPSHGLDQTLLKFRRDVRPWSPQVTVVSFLNASPLRHTTMYLILRPDQQLPFTKPRFLLQEGALSVLNAPVVSAEAVLAHRSIHDLPRLEHDSRFQVAQWSASPLHNSYVARWLFSQFPRWPPSGSQPSPKEIVELASRLSEQLVAEIRAAGSEALLVSLPVQDDLAGGATAWRNAVVEQLARKNIEVFDMAPCLLRQVSLEEAFVQRGSANGAQNYPGAAHYSRAGNGAVAACLAPVVSQLLEPGGRVAAGSKEKSGQRIVRALPQF